MDPIQDSGSVISLAEAQQYVRAFKQKFSEEPKASLGGINKINLILQQPDCAGIRFYNGIDESTGKRNLVLVGVDSNDKDMTSGVILERMGFCPPFCDVTSALY